MINAIVSNLGNVICTLDRRRQMSNFIDLCPGIDHERVVLAMRSQQGWDRMKRFERGTLDPATYKMEIEEAMGLENPLDDKDFWQAYVALEPCEPMIEACKMVKEKHPDIMLAAYGLADPVTFNQQYSTAHLSFDVLLPGFAMGTQYSGSDLHRRILKCFGTATVKECLVVDSSPEFLDSAEALGYHVHEYTTPVMLVHALASLDLL